MENYSTDQVRMLARSFAIPGDHQNQTSSGTMAHRKKGKEGVVFMDPTNHDVRCSLGGVKVGVKVKQEEPTSADVPASAPLQVFHATEDGVCVV